MATAQRSATLRQMMSIDSECGGRPSRGCGTGYAPENRRTPLNKLTRPKNSVVNVKYSHGFVVAASAGRRPLQSKHISWSPW